MKSGERLDRYLVRMGLAPSRKAAREFIARGMVRVNGRRCSKGHVVAEGDRVEVQPAYEGAALTPEAQAPLQVLFEDSAVLVINKPGLVPCHPLRPGETGTVMNAVVARCPETASAGDKPLEGGLVHRLDNGTSGALIIARNPASFAALRDAIRQGLVLRRYEALVAGLLKQRLELATPIAHHPKNPRKMVAVSDADEQRRLKARPALTLVEPVQHFGNFTLVSVSPQSGSRHQIRIHLASAGFPIAGDRLYGGPVFATLAPGRFYLHLGEVQFDSPVSGRVRAAAPRPADLENALAGISDKAKPPGSEAARV